MSERICFLLQIKPERLQDYLRVHADVWPEMLDALRLSGWRNYSLFVREPEGLVVGYLEADDFDAAQKAMAQHDVSQKWQESMAEYFDIPAGQRPDEALLRLSEYFHLD